MTRPHRIGIALLPIVFATVGAARVPATSPSDGAPAAAREESQPNVLWFISDDPSPYLGAYGDPVARTPTIDRLATEGIRFDVVYSDAPVCAPSRFALITGLFSATRRVLPGRETAPAGPTGA
jgi:hypothetical protein